jgi:uncharacterized phage-associated protein
VAGVYNSATAAQLAALFLAKAPDRRLDRVKLMKLMYLADRTSFERYGATITGDDFASMEHGLVPSTTYAAVCGEGTAAGTWSQWVETRDEFVECLVADVDLDAVDLSRADVQIVDDLWAQHGSTDKWDLVKWVHLNCPEWIETTRSRPVSLRDIGRALQMGEDELDGILEQQHEMDAVERTLVALRTRG